MMVKLSGVSARCRAVCVSEIGLSIETKLFKETGQSRCRTSEARRCVERRLARESPRRQFDNGVDAKGDARQRIRRIE